MLVNQHWKCFEKTGLFVLVFFFKRSFNVEMPESLLVLVCAIYQRTLINNPNNKWKACLSASDLHGGFELHAAEDLERQNQLLEGLEQLRLSCGQDQNESRAFSPLLDVYGHSDSLTSSRTSALLPNWLLAENTRPDDALSRSEDSSQRGGSPVRNGHSERRADVVSTVVDVPRHKRPLLSQVFGSLKKSHNSTVSPAVESLHEKHTEPEFDLTTVHISKTKQSLGIHCFLFILFNASK